MKNKGRYHWGMLYTLEGTEIYDFSGKIIYAEPNTVLMIPKDVAYSIYLNDQKSLVMTIDFELSCSMDISPFIIKTGENNSIKSIFKEMFNLSKSNTPSQQALLKSLFYKIISQLILSESLYNTSTNFLKISNAIDYMHKHCLEGNFRIEKLSKISGISNRYFEKLFFKEYKVSPKQYIIAYKIDLAKELLQNEKKSVTDVATSLGYNDIYHFSKIFKKHTGMTPGECKNRK